MALSFLDRLSAQTDELKATGLFKPERVLGSPQQPVVTLADGRELINLCANNYLGLANHPAIREAAHGRDRPLRLWHGLGALHLRHAGGAQGTRGAAERVPGRGRRDPLFVVLRRERGPVRDVARRAGRRHQRRAEPREHHRRHPPLQGADGCAMRTTTSTSSRRGSRRRRSARVRADRDGRRLLDGRRHRPAQGHLRPRRPVRRARHGRRLARHGLRRPGRTRHAGISRRHGAHRHPHGYARQGARRRRGRLHGGAQGDRRAGCASARGPTCSRTACRP